MNPKWQQMETVKKQGMPFTDNNRERGVERSYIVLTIIFISNIIL